MNRRHFLTIGTAVTVSSLNHTSAAVAESDEHSDFRPRYCLNTSTVRGQDLSLPEQVDLAATAGYDGIEPWIRDIEKYQQSGGSLDDVRKRIADAGLTVESAIGFAQWIVDDESARTAGLEQMKRDMELLKQIGGVRIAAPPVGGHGGDAPDIDLFAAAERYRAVLEIGDEIGITPQVEIWGPAKNLSRLGQAVFVAVECGHPKACVLPDVYHIFRGGTDFAGLGIIAGTAIHCFHMNDYPGGKERTEYNDGDRVFPGDGIAPLSEILQTLKSNGFTGALSLELFNKDYWKRPAEDVAREGLQKMQAAIGKTT